MGSNATIFYTTAQVTEMVELSDQNVRKYVRLLEDRNYEVAKDEHNRRLFSGEDVSVLRELIRLAKQPGFTLETAADEIVRQVPTIVTEGEARTPMLQPNNELTELLTSVVTKMDEMRDEHALLKEKMDMLIQKLDDNASLVSLQAPKVESLSVDESKLESDIAEASKEATESAKSVNTSDEAEEFGGDGLSSGADVPSEADVKLDEGVSSESDVKLDEVDEHQAPKVVFEAEKRKQEGRIDMSAYKSDESSVAESDADLAATENVATSTSEEAVASTDQSSNVASRESEEAPKGAFGKLMSFFKGK